MITKKQYIEYLLTTPINYTCSNLSDHLENVSHDVVTDFLQNSRFTPRDLWDLVENRIDDSEEAFLLVDDSVQNKKHSHSIETVKLQYSGNEHGLVKGIGLVNLVHTNGFEGDFYPIDYRVYAPEADGKTKNEHFREMFIRANTDKRIKARNIAFDSWYASADNLKLIHRSGWTFFTTLKSNRKVSLSKDVGYQHLEEIEWDADTLRSGQLVRLREVPFWLKLFKLVDTEGNIEWVITNNLTEDFTRLRAIEAIRGEMASRRISPKFQATDRQRKMSMPQSAFAKKSLRNALLLQCVGGGQGQSPRNETNRLSIEERTIYRISKITTEKSNDSRLVILDKRKS